jgi:hypothetical protein
MGAFYESIAMAADLEARSASFSPRFTREGSDLFVGVVTIRERRADACWCRSQPTHHPSGCAAAG